MLFLPVSVFFLFPVPAPHKRLIFLSTCVSTPEVDLSGNNLGDRGAGAVADMLQRNSTLVKISLSGNGLTDEAAERLSRALTVNTKLQHLDLSHNALAERAGSADLRQTHRGPENVPMLHQ